MSVAAAIRVADERSARPTCARRSRRSKAAAGGRRRPAARACFRSASSSACATASPARRRRRRRTPPHDASSSGCSPTPVRTAGLACRSLRWGEPGCGAYVVRPRLGLIGMLAGWWEVKLSSGCP